VATETRVMIAGSRYGTRAALDYARRVVQRANQLGWTVLVGDNPKGVDMAVVNECRRLKAKVIVVGLTEHPRNGGCGQSPHGQYVRFECGVYRARRAAACSTATTNGTAIWSICVTGRCSSGILFVWNGDSRGTKSGYEYALRRGKQAHLINFDGSPVG